MLSRNRVGVAHLSAALMLALIAPPICLAAESAVNNDGLPSSLLYFGMPPAFERDQNVVAKNSSGTVAASSNNDVKSAASGTGAAKPTRSAQIEANKSYLIPVGEIVGFEVLLNRYDYYFIDRQVYGVSTRSMWRNLDGKWVIDTDPFSVNQFMHPVQGSIFSGLARASGLDFWESMRYALGGSMLWKIAGETGAPSINDMITTTFAGPFLGEPLFRMASLLLEDDGATPGLWHELGAAAISPSLGFTRHAFGNRFRTVFESHDPALFSYVRIGASKVNNSFNANAPQKVQLGAMNADYHMSYGLPGKDGYTYTRPFDYFDFEFTANSATVFENIMTRGLLTGQQYAAGDNYRGVWGLYGSYDYFSPQIFRISSTAVSLGTTAQWWLSKTVALQGTVLGGLGYGAAGTIHGSGQRDYHYGATPQALVALRLIFGDTASLDLTARSYDVSDVASTEDRGSEHIFRGEAAFTVRIYGHHAITLKYDTSQRNASYPDIPDTHQSVTTIGLLYTYIFGNAKDVTRFGAVDWRPTD
ncbi:MAG: DUF3943 domain-containing protein [Sulfuricaulis sp.]